uniref:Uncharacterized protein n=1 Tax=viral metagenome TaxID=1070528 RepID=A0A6C0HQD2_9ZZZZ
MEITNAKNLCKAVETINEITIPTIPTIPTMPEINEDGKINHRSS